MSLRQSCNQVKPRAGIFNQSLRVSFADANCIAVRIENHGHIGDGVTTKGDFGDLEHNGSI
jgi:hypothetical protein